MESSIGGKKAFKVKKFFMAPWDSRLLFVRIRTSLGIGFSKSFFTFSHNNDQSLKSTQNQLKDGNVAGQLKLYARLDIFP